ncbi:hypothetical protein [Streptomyces sp. NBC_00690]|uniref:hypothetical protein n=1 Tax=Streptomyces sp. NBC_00690 TaxID=2975808 RepID=UPI002E2A86F4|nr:hypothetical protein [Streptomyces sp. NBC_00690]
MAQLQVVDESRPDFEWDKFSHGNVGLGSSHGCNTHNENLLKNPHHGYGPH